ncbi:Hint domain-containing protein [Methylorubrum extorquens]|uniref:Hint domain-containing protein n=1 Tax=Methylorubrum extorquens TaxID=408 RepID=UPI0039C8C8CE
MLPINTGSTPLCFGTGTHIRTSRGEVAVEDLQVGDRAVTASGALRPITWIGHREISAGSGSLSFNQQPVRVRAGAFGHDLPARDLFLSPGHPVLVGADADNEGGALVPVMCLINGTTITREPVASVTYWHIELDAHDILLAEGLPAESYIDGGDRPFFSEASDHALHNPDFVVPGWDGRCRPVAVDGPAVEAERLRLDAIFAGSLNAQCDWTADDVWAAA